jgi:hypothetical protein
VWLLVASVAIGGTGIAAMHYFGMAAVSMHGTVQYNLRLVGISVLIAIVTCAAALAAGLRVRGVWSSLGVSIVMGVAISGMHYTGMAAMRVYAGGSGLVRPGEPSSSLLLPLLLGASVVTFLLMLIVAMSPNEDEILADASVTQRLRAGASLAVRESTSHQQEYHRGSHPYPDLSRIHPVRAATGARSGLAGRRSEAGIRDEVLPCQERHASPGRSQAVHGTTIPNRKLP